MTTWLEAFEKARLARGEFFIESLTNPNFEGSTDKFLPLVAHTKNYVFFSGDDGFAPTVYCVRRTSYNLK